MIPGAVPSGIRICVKRVVPNNFFKISGGGMVNFFDDLCYRCEMKRSAEGHGTLAGDHCHHEPREKPVSGCAICEGGPITVLGNGFITSILAKFCPECGRSLT